MKVSKITNGFVVQQYDTDTGRCVAQEFVAGDQVAYENEDGEPVDWREPQDGYQPFEMVQPANMSRGSGVGSSGKTVLKIEVDYDDSMTDPEALAAAMDRLLKTVRCTPGILDEYGNPSFGMFFVAEPGKCDCEYPGFYYSGVPGIIAHMKDGRLAPGAKVERCDLCRRYPSDAAALQRLRELGYAPP